MPCMHELGQTPHIYTTMPEERIPSESSGMVEAWREQIIPVSSIMADP